MSQSLIYVHTNVTRNSSFSSPQEKEGGRKINTFLFHRCLYGKCEAMVTAEESQCCRELDAYWALVENVTPTLDVHCLTLHPGCEACCLSPYVLQIAYMHFRQEHGPLQASRHECLGQR